MVELNRAVAVAMRDGPVAGLVLIEAILERGELADYYLVHWARADLFRRLGQWSDALTAYQATLRLTRHAPERRLIEKRVRELEALTA